MSENVIQTSFSAGELSPNLNARVDFAKYRSGAATMRNFFVDYRSGASTRTGTEHIRSAAIGAKKVRLVRFQQSTLVTYVLEFGQNYLRFTSNGGSVVEPPIAITGITQASPAVVSVVNSFVNPQMVFISGVEGMPQINNQYFILGSTTAGTVTLAYPDTGLPVNSIPYDPYISGGTIQRVYTIGTPYTEAELSRLKFSQNAAVMNITHPNHPPYKLTLISATNWTLVPATIGASIAGPGIFLVQSSTTGAVQYKYAVTSVDDNNQESTEGNVVILTGVADLRTVAGNNHIVWNGVSGAFAYNIYGSSPNYTGLNANNSGLGFIGSVPAQLANFFDDSNIGPDFTQTPPIHDNPFAGVNPACSSYFQQRLVFANGGGQNVATFWASKVGASYNFDVSNPPQANDAVTGTLVSLEVNEIKSLVPMPTGLLALTTNGTWLISGGSGGVASQGGPLTPSTATATPQAYVGANDVPPIVVNYDILFVQAKGSIVRDMTYNIYANIYTGNDISILSSHLFYGHQVLEWSYAEEPFKSIWCIREDGIALNLTVVKEQDMYGWSRHDTFGNFTSVASVTEGQTDATYFAVERLGADNKPHLYIERLADRTFEFGAEDAWCVDAGVSTVANFPDATLTVTAATGNVDILASDPVFTIDMIGWVVRSGGGIIKVIGFIDAQRLTGTVIKPIDDLLPNDPQERPDRAPSGTWTIDEPFTNIYGLDHLEGKQVAVLADGGVVNGLVVHNGTIVLPSPATKVLVGLAFQAQLQTMPLDLGNEVNTVQGKRKKIGALTVRVKDSRGVKTGRTFGTVTPIKELNRVTLMGLPIKLVTADERIVMDPLWDVPGQICIQVDDPLPATILGVVPEIVVGDTGGK